MVGERCVVLKSSILFNFSLDWIWCWRQSEGRGVPTKDKKCIFPNYNKKSVGCKLHCGALARSFIICVKNCIASGCRKRGLWAVAGERSDFRVVIRTIFVIFCSLGGISSVRRTENYLLWENRDAERSWIKLIFKFAARRMPSPLRAAISRRPCCSSRRERTTRAAVSVHNQEIAQKAAFFTTVVGRRGKFLDRISKCTFVVQHLKEILFSILSLQCSSIFHYCLRRFWFCHWN